MSHGHIVQIKKLSLRVMNARVCIVLVKYSFCLNSFKMAVSWRYKRDQKMVTHLTWALHSLLCSKFHRALRQDSEVHGAE